MNVAALKTTRNSNETPAFYQEIRNAENLLL